MSRASCRRCRETIDLLRGAFLISVWFYSILIMSYSLFQFTLVIDSNPYAFLVHALVAYIRTLKRSERASARLEVNG